MNTGSKLRDRADPSQLPSMNDGHAITERLSIGKNVGREENRLAFVLQLLHQVANFASPHWVES